MIDLTKYKRVLTFFAHPDDETLAAGATLKKLTDLGSEIFVSVPATGIHARKYIEKKIRDKALEKLRNDCYQALSILGVRQSNIFFGEFSDNEMDRHTLLEAIQWLENIIDTINPQLILTHHRYCTNIDHRYCHEAVVVATRPSINRHIDVICGEVPSSTGYLKPTQWEPNLYIDASEKNIDLKIKAMETYKNEARPDPHPRSKEVLKALAKVRGSESGFYFAEAFMVQKVFG